MVGGGIGRTHNKVATFGRVNEMLGYIPKEDLTEAMKVRNTPLSDLPSDTPPPPSLPITHASVATWAPHPSFSFHSHLLSTS